MEMGPTGGGRLILGKMAVTRALISGKHGPKPRGNVIVLHGSCDTGSGMKDWLTSIGKTEFAFQNYDVLYPSAPLQKYTPLNGQVSSVWFDRLAIGPEFPEDKISIDMNARELSHFIKMECERTEISLEKTIVGGFSMGGIMAMHMGFRFHPQLAGVFTLSSFLNPDSTVFSHLETRSDPNRGVFKLLGTPKPIPRSQRSLTPAMDRVYNSVPTTDQRMPLPRLFMSQGRKDPLVDYRWGKATFKKLRDSGVKGHFFTVPNSRHEIVKSQLSLLHDWIGEVLESPQPASPFTKVRKHHVNDEVSIPVFE